MSAARAPALDGRVLSIDDERAAIRCLLKNTCIAGDSGMCEFLAHDGYLRVQERSQV